MPVFKFRLARILDIKEKFKEAKKAELFEIEREIELRNRKIDFLEKEIEKLEKQNIESGKDLKDHYYKFEFIVSQIEKLKIEIADFEKERNKILSELIEMEKEVKVLDKLKEKKREEFVKDILRKEMRFLDEIAQRSRKYE